MGKSKADLFFSLPKNWEDILQEYFSEGATDIEAHLALGVNAIDHKTLLTVEVYNNAFINGMAICEAFWMKWARETLMDESEYIASGDGTMIERKQKKIDTKLFEAMMKRMFAWDKKLDKKEDKDLEKEQPKKDAEKFTKKYGIKAVK